MGVERKIGMWFRWLHGLPRIDAPSGAGEEKGVETAKANVLERREHVEHPVF